ncbi:MAG: TIGR02452 family protein [Gemmataceae bacterium]
MVSRDKLARMGQETLELLEQGEYTSTNGRVVRIAELVAEAKHHTIHYTPDMFDDVLERRAETLKTIPRHQTVFEVRNCTTLAAARDLLNATGDVDVYCLNFASAKNPGGGFLSGARAQEESLARATGLYPCINQMQGMYLAGRECGTCLYTDHMIYSPKVPVIRDDEGNLLDAPYLISIITSPAVNSGALMPTERSKIGSTMLARMEKVLSLAIVHHHHTLVLGAWGCGVFKNSPSDVARWFYGYLIETPAFEGVFRKVVFAITDSSKEKRFIGPFEQQFS